MSIITVDKHELSNIMQYINMVKVKFDFDDGWTVVPVLYYTEEGVEILLNNSKNAAMINISDRVIVKFQRLGFEYLANGYVRNVGIDEHVTITIDIEEAKKYYNLRKFMRFDTNLKVSLTLGKGSTADGIAKNISKGGAMIITNADIGFGDELKIKLEFDSGNILSTSVKVLRKNSLNDNEFSYGVQFIKINEYNIKIIDTEIAEYERMYLKSLYYLRDYAKKCDITFDTKIAVFSYNEADESYAVKEELIKNGAENFEVFYDFNFYNDYFNEEKPKLVIVDSGEFNDELVMYINKINSEFPDKILILLLPLEYSEQSEYIASVEKSLNMILYKPLIYNEFEQAILKYL